MTRYECNCEKCTNKAIGNNGAEYCLPTRLYHKSVLYIKDGYAGTKEDPDPICCDYYTTESRQMEIINVDDW